MTTIILTHPDCGNHITPPGHAEQVARYDAVMSALEPLGLETVKAPYGADSDIERAHSRSHIASIRRAAPEQGWRRLDPDTYMSPGSLAAAYRAVGAVVRGVDLVMEGRANNVFAAIRPPGHHAERETAMGFCIFGNVAIGAKHALDHHGLSRVAILDFDVHHGNGTQDLVQDDGRILFCSSHEMPLYPGTGAASERGQAGNCVNLPLRAGTRGPEFRRLWDEVIFPRVAAHRPEMILVSAGFDAHRADPLANIELEVEDFAWISGRICDLADEHAKGRVVSALEGGYDLQALGDSAAAHVRVLKERGQ